MHNWLTLDTIRGRLLLCAGIALLLHAALTFVLFQWGIPHSPACLIVSFMYCAGVLLTLFCIIHSVLHDFEMLAKSAVKFGNSPNMQQKKIPERGAAEIRRSARAFNIMQKQIQNLLHERDDMFTAIAHDIRTPLSRMQLDAEGLDDGIVKEKFLKNIHEVALIVEKGMALTKSGLSAEVPKPLDLVSFIENMIEQLTEFSPAASIDIATDSTDRICVIARTSGLEICLRNLIANGMSYGNGKVHIHISATPDTAIVDVQDDGPGIPDCCLEKAMRPFVRLDTSKKSAAGGMGLGLSIASNAAKLDGGSIVLSNLQEGGLQARLTLPLAHF